MWRIKESELCGKRGKQFYGEPQSANITMYIRDNN